MHQQLAAISNNQLIQQQLPIAVTNPMNDSNNININVVNDDNSNRNNNTNLSNNNNNTQDIPLNNNPPPSQQLDTTNVRKISQSINTKKKVPVVSVTPEPTIPVALPSTLELLVLEHYEHDLPSHLNSVKTHWAFKTRAAYSRRKLLFEYVYQSAQRRYPGMDQMEQFQDKVIDTAKYIDINEVQKMSLYQFQKVLLERSCDTRKKRNRSKKINASIVSSK